MLAATVVGTLLVPVFYVAVQGLVERRRMPGHGGSEPLKPAPGE